MSRQWISRVSSLFLLMSIMTLFNLSCQSSSVSSRPAVPTSTSITSPPPTPTPTRRLTPTSSPTQQLTPTASPTLAFTTFPKYEAYRNEQLGIEMVTPVDWLVKENENAPIVFFEPNQNSQMIQGSIAMGRFDSLTDIAIHLADVTAPELFQRHSTSSIQEATPREVTIGNYPGFIFPTTASNSLGELYVVWIVALLPNTSFIILFITPIEFAGKTDEMVEDIVPTIRFFTPPWKGWTSEEKGTLIEAYFQALQKGDHITLGMIVEQYQDDIPEIVSTLLQSSVLAQRYGEIGWSVITDVTFTGDELQKIAGSMADHYAEQTGDTGLQEQVTDHELEVLSSKLETQAIELGIEGYDALNNGDPQLALTKFFEALEIFRSIDASLNEARTLINIGAAYFQLEEVELASLYYEQALPIVEQEQAYELAARAHSELAWLYYYLDEQEKGRLAAIRALDMARLSDNEDLLKGIQESLAPLLEQ